MTSDRIPGKRVDLADVHAALERVQTLKRSKSELIDKLDRIESSKSSVSVAVYEKVKAEYIEKIRGFDRDFDPMKKEVLSAFVSLRDEYGDTKASVDGDATAAEELKLRHALGEFTDDEYEAQIAALGSANSSLQNRHGQVEVALKAIFEEFAEEPEFLAFSGPFPEAPAAPSPQASPVPDEQLQEEPVEEPAASPPVFKEPGAASDEDLLDAAFGGDGIPELDEDILEDVADEPEISQQAKELGVGESSVPKEFFEEVVDASGKSPLGADEPGLQPSEVSGLEKPAEPLIPSLIIKDNENREHTYQLQDGPTMLGRAPENDIVLLEENISRRHAKIVRDKGAVQITDLKSSNGTWVNGKRMAPHQPCILRDNDLIKMGKSLMLFKCAPDD